VPIRRKRLALPSLPFDNERMTIVTEPQAWVLIGIFGTTVFAIAALMTHLFRQTLSTTQGSLRESVDGVRDNLTASVNGVRESVDALREVMTVRFDEVERRMDGFERRLDRVEVKIDSLDRDVQAISRRVFGTDPL
jgi:hypothetical protein